MILLLDELATPVGPLYIVSDGERLVAVEFAPAEERLHPMLRARFGDSCGLREAADPQGFTSALAAYFAGDLAAIDGLAAAAGGTQFQRRVWDALRRIPCGETLSYAGLARTIGQPTAIRAVGLANGANPVSIVVPCHRVIGTDGSLTGYGGGLARKRWLLAHEGAATQASSRDTILNSRSGSSDSRPARPAN
jgi:methylated-DNA-[protein]-cysteine S-methyltransferase